MKNYVRILKFFLTVTVRKSFVFVSRFAKKKSLSYFNIAIFWVGGKNCTVKNENCIVFPKSQYCTLIRNLHSHQGNYKEFICF